MGQVNQQSSAEGMQCSGWLLKQHPCAAGVGMQELLTGPGPLGGCMRPWWSLITGLGHPWAVHSAIGTRAAAG